MKKFMNLPFGDEIVEREIVDYRWEIVTVHFDNEDVRYRAIKLDDNKTIISESTFNTKEKAQAFIDKQ